MDRPRLDAPDEDLRASDSSVTAAFHFHALTIIDLLSPLSSLSVLLLSLKISASAQYNGGMR